MFFILTFSSEALYLFLVSSCSPSAHPMASRAVGQSTTAPLEDTSVAHSQNIWEALPENQGLHWHACNVRGKEISISWEWNRPSFCYANKNILIKSRQLHQNIYKQAMPKKLISLILRFSFRITHCSNWWISKDYVNVLWYVLLTATHRPHLLPLLVQLRPQEEAEPMSRVPSLCVQGWGEVEECSGSSSSLC